MPIQRSLSAEPWSTDNYLPGSILFMKKAELVDDPGTQFCNENCKFCYGMKMDKEGYGHPAVVLSVGFSNSTEPCKRVRIVQVTSYTQKAVKLEFWADGELQIQKLQSETADLFENSKAGRNFRGCTDQKIQKIQQIVHERKCIQELDKHRPTTPIFNKQSSCPQVPNRPILETVNSEQLPKQSYVKFNEIYCLPLNHFTPWGNHRFRLIEESFINLWRLCRLPGEPLYDRSEPLYNEDYWIGIDERLREKWGS